MKGQTQTQPRIITGTAKGLKLKVPHKSRPISDRAKSSLFSIIGPDILDKRILDLYAGSGSLGIEALSRGAQNCTFVDISKYAKTDIADNLERAKLTSKAEIRKQKVLQFLDEQPSDSFDIIFADPPFDIYTKDNRKLKALLEHSERIIPKGGAIILKHPHDTELPDVPTLTLADSRRHGILAVTIWVKTKDYNDIK